jgi:hypothetical protein
MNEYLMNQSVITFSNSTARGSAITTPVEGMITYLEDTQTYESWNGSAWVGLVPQSGNAIINGAFEINQRNFTSTTISNAYGFDRWKFLYTSGTTTYSAQTFTPGQAPEAGYEYENFARLEVTGQEGSSANVTFRQGIEGVRTFAGEFVTASFWAKASSGTPSVSVEFSQLFGTAGSATLNTFVSKVQISESWARYSATAFVPSVAGKTIGPGNQKLELIFWLSSGTDFDSRTGSLGLQNNTFDIFGVQLEAGPAPTNFRRNSQNIESELSACQRYFRRLGGVVANSNFGVGQCATTTQARVILKYFPVMRAAPSISFNGLVGDYIFQSAGVNNTPTSFATSANNSQDVTIQINTTSLVAGNAGSFIGNSLNATIDLNSEI